MKKIFFTLTIGTTLAISSCTETTKKTDEGEIHEQEYISRELGWIMEIPKGWEVSDLEKTKESNERGAKALEETLDMEVDDSAVKNLITFQKNPFNIFHSSSEPFKLEYEGEWEENDSLLKIIVYDTYKNQGIKADSSATTIEKIDGLDFRTYSFTIYSPKGDLIMKQIIYSRLIDGFSFTVSVNYNNEKDKGEMLQAFRKSKFNKRR